jgi:hypothetical protein
LKRDKDDPIEQILKTLDRLAVDPEALAYWTTAVETTAKHMCKDKTGKIEFLYCPKEKSMRFYLKDSRSRDCLQEAIEIHLPQIPETLQGFFTVFKYNLKYVEFR